MDGDIGPLPGLVEAADILRNVNGISFVYFDQSDVVRHHLVQRIINAYEENKSRQQQMPLALDEQAGARAEERESPLLEN